MSLLAERVPMSLIFSLLGHIIIWSALDITYAVYHNQPATSVTRAQQLLRWATVWPQ